MDYKQLILVYKNFYEFSIEIATLLEKKEYEEIPKSVLRREKLTSQLGLMTKQFPPSDGYPQELKELIQKIDTLEKSNLKKMMEIRVDLKRDFDKITTSEKIMSAYAPTESKASMIDLVE